MISKLFVILYFQKFENEKDDQDAAKKTLQNDNYKAIESMTRQWPNIFSLQLK